MATDARHTSDRPRSVDWRLIALVAGGILAVIVVRNVFVEAHRVIGWAVAAIVVAVLLMPVIDALDRRMPRALAFVSTFVAVVAVSIAIAVVYTSSLRAETDRLVEAAPDIASDIESRGDRLGEVAVTFQLADRIEELATRLDEAVGTGSETIRSAALSAPAFFVSMILVIFLLLFGPRMVNGAFAQFPARQRDRLESASRRAVRRGQRYMWATLGQSVVVAAALGLLAHWMGAPAPALFGLFAAVASLIPYLGVLIGALPLLVVGVGVSPWWQVTIAALVVVAIVVVEALWWQPRLHRTSLYVGPAIPLIVGILGAAIYGIGGALYSMALSVFLLALVDELDMHEADLPTPLDEYAEGQETESA